MTTSRFLIAGLALGLASLATAQTDASDAPHGPGPRGHRPPPSPIIAVLDADKDHVISAAEIANAPTRLATLDTNADGALSVDELRPTLPDGAPTPPPPPPGGKARPGDPVMLALDADNNGVLSATEIANAAASLKALDANADGQLTPDELRPLPPTSA